MLKLMKMEVKEYVDDIVIVEYEFQTHRNDTITFELDLKEKNIHNLKIDGIVGLNELDELKRIIQDSYITVYYSDYI